MTSRPMTAKEEAFMLDLMKLFNKHSFQCGSMEMLCVCAHMTGQALAMLSDPCNSDEMAQSMFQNITYGYHSMCEKIDNIQGHA